MSDIINIDSILLKHLGPLDYACIQHDLKAIPKLSLAIKEIVESVIDKCAEEAKAKENHSEYGAGEIWVDSQSILNVKKFVKY